ncbi:MAG: extracellular solute-binding protein [Enterocloster clostridioformis]
MAVFSTDESHQQAAVRFLKWFTEPEQNIRFAVATGYLPVQEKALRSVSDLVAHVESRDNVQAVRKNQTSLMPWKTIMYMSAKPFRGSYDMDQIFSISLENCMNADLETLSSGWKKVRAGSRWKGAAGRGAF